jgi:H+/Cl- antiporter ClcA
MAATLASVCSVPLTSVLLLFELTKDYRILLPLMVSMMLVLSSLLLFGSTLHFMQRMFVLCFLLCYCICNLMLFGPL